MAVVKFAIKFVLFILLLFMVPYTMNTLHSAGISQLSQFILWLRGPVFALIVSLPFSISHIRRLFVNGVSFSVSNLIIAILLIAMIHLPRTGIIVPFDRVRSFYFNTRGSFAFYIIVWFNILHAFVPKKESL